MQQQHIRRKCNTELYEAIASNRRTFDIRVDHEDVQVDDFYTFVETVDDEPQREVYRRVSYVVRTKELPETVQEDAARHGLAIVGFVPAEYGSIEALLADGGIVVAFALEIQDVGQYTVLEGPAILPILASPRLNVHQIGETIGVSVWPTGQYSVMIGCHLGPIENASQDIIIQEIIVLVRTLENGDDKFVQVDHRFLLAGSLRNLQNIPVKPYFGEDDGSTNEELDQATLDRVMEAAEEV